MSEPIEESSKSNNEDDCEDDSNAKKSDFMKMSGNVFSNIPIKMSIILFFMGMLIFSDLFIEGVLQKIDGAVMGECTTTKGSIIQLLVLVLGFIIMDLVVKYEIL